MNVVDDLLVRHHDGRVVHVSALRRCTYVVREPEHHRDVSDLALRHRGERVVRVLELHLYMNVVDDLLVRHHDGHVVHVSVLRRCTCAVRELDVHLHNGHVIHLVFRHPYAVVYRKDSKHHYCALRLVLRRAVIQRGCEHLDRVVREVHGIRLLPP